ncbi:MAG TPA: hypothetical protein VKW70_02970 [Terriglobia bacterium]|nr:hypothetical protein [Terriglobia bacterium]
MLLKLNGKVEIEDIWNHAPEQIQELRDLLAQGVPAFADAHRRNFYEIEHDSRVFYIHISPRGKVLLLAVWPKENFQPMIRAASHMASASVVNSAL